jgi:hypothetical protein
MAELQVQVRISLVEMRDQARARLQRIMDVLRFSRAASIVLSEEEFQSQLDFFSLAPAANLALGFEDARKEADQWTRLHCLRDAIDVVGAFLEDAYRACRLYSLAKTEGATYADLQSVDGACRTFHSLGLPKKVAALKREFGVESDFDSHIISLNDARNCLVHRLGIVTERETRTNSDFWVRWMEIGVEATSPDGAEVVAVESPQRFAEGWSVALVVRPKERVYKLGERLDLSYRELLGAIFSHQNYVNNLTTSVENYARSLGIEFLPSANS